MPRFTIDIGEKLDELLQAHAKKDETTKAEVIRRAIATYTLLKQEVERGGIVSITNIENKVLKDIMLP